ncbi:MAG: AMP-binding protein, partial [Actinobacteria bacterium]|nr:AMP-binding protein [Actinomycetota bacterium]
MGVQRRRRDPEPFGQATQGQGLETTLADQRPGRGHDRLALQGGPVTALDHAQTVSVNAVHPGGRPCYRARRGVAQEQAGPRRVAPVTALLEPVVSVRGDEPAVVDARGATSWRALDARVTRLVHALRSRGLTSGDRIVAMLGNQSEIVELSVACAHGGWVLVPLNWHWVAREIAYVIDDAGAAAVVVDERWAEVMGEALSRADGAGLRARLLVGDSALDGFAGFDAYEALLASGVEDPITDAEKGGPMFYTSGTTGDPKGVRSALTTVGGPPEMFALMAHSFGPIIDITPIGPHTPPGDTASVQLVCGPLYHSAQWVFAMFALYCGATIVLQHKFDAAGLLDLVDEHGVTNLHLVPTQ